MRILLLVMFFSVSLLQSAFAQRTAGELSLYVFHQGKPVPQLLLEIGDNIHQLTNIHGAAHVIIPSGVHVLEVSQTNKRLVSLELLTIAGENIQIIVNLPDQGLSPDIDIETSNSESKKLTTPTQTNNPDTPEKAPGQLTGKIIDIEKQQPIHGAQIFISGLALELLSDKNGEFTTELPEGRYSISVIHTAFATQTIDDIVIHSQQSTSQQIELTPAGLELAEFIVLAPYLEGSVASVVAEERNSSAVAEVLGAEQMSKSGDSNAAAALKRITGLTVVGGKFVYVRGLGERYSNALLNGSSLPSPDPTRRVVPLDMFPTGILDSMFIQKTYSADMPGEFGGGTIQMKTKSIPEDFFLKLSLSTSFESGSTFATGHTYKGGKYDWLGVDNGRRDLPSDLKNATAGDRELKQNNIVFSNGFTAEEIEQFGQAMPKNYDTQEKSLPPDFVISLSTGNSIKKKYNTFGYTVGLSYSNAWSNEAREKREFSVEGEDNKLVENSDSNKETTEQTIDTSGILSLGAQLGDHHKITSTTLLIRKTSNSTKLSNSENADNIFRSTELEWTERSLLTQQLAGNHQFDWQQSINLDWRYAYSKAVRYAPDFREYTYKLINDEYIFSDRGDSNKRQYSDLDDKAQEIGLDISFPFKHIGDETTLKFGAALVNKSRDSKMRTYTFGSDSIPSDIRRLTSLEDIFTDENISAEGFRLMEITRATDNYTAEQDITSFYAMIDALWTEQYRITGGIRNERSSQNVKTFKLFDPSNEPIIADLSTSDMLPSLVATWFIKKDMQIRAGMSRTLSRPDFKELSEAPYTDPVTGDEKRGNAELQRTVINNVDLRWEWYFSSNENMSLGVFYKKFNKPIEESLSKLGGDAFISTFQNADTANNMGIEAEVRKDFSFLGDQYADYYVSSNVAWIRSRIKLNPEKASVQTSNNRPLQGQSPYVINFQLGYDHFEKGINASLLYNVSGSRISEVGTIGRPDKYQQAFHQLDFVLGYKFKENLKFKFKLNNLLNPAVTIKQGDKTTSSYHKGRKLSLGLDWNL